MKKYDDFIEDWEVDTKQKSAVHKSGLEISFENFNDDGSMRLKYENLIPWQKKIYMETKSGQEVDALRTELSQQFAEIYTRDMSEKTKPILELGMIKFER